MIHIGDLEALAGVVPLPPPEVNVLINKMYLFVTIFQDLTIS